MKKLAPDYFDVCHFIYRELRLLDQRRWEDWLALFHESGDYWVPLVNDDERPGINISILHEDRDKLELRCSRYSHPKIISQNPPSRTVHLVSNIELRENSTDTSSFTALAAFIMVEYRQNESTWWSGHYEYNLVQAESGDLSILRKKILLLNNEGVLPTIQVPF